VGEVEPGDRYRVDESGQDPGQELDCREQLHSKKQVPGRLDPHVVQVAEGHQANGEADDGKDEEGLEGAEDRRFVRDDDQEIQEQGHGHCNSGTDLGDVGDPLDHIEKGV